jgi:hypothetical protein
MYVTGGVPSDIRKPHSLFLFLHGSVAGCADNCTQFACYVDTSSLSESDVCVLSQIFCRYISYKLELVVPEDGNRSSFRNVVFSSSYNTGRWKNFQKSY